MFSMMRSMVPGSAMLPWCIYRLLRTSESRKLECGYVYPMTTGSRRALRTWRMRRSLIVSVVQILAEKDVCRRPSAPFLI